jgi:hypothetical protein
VFSYYIAPQICDPDQIEKYADNPQLLRNNTADNYPIMQQLTALFLGMPAGSVSVESLFSLTGIKCNS